MKGTELAVLDKGYLRLVDYMGDDRAICEAARVSYKSKEREPGADQKLVKYLLDREHGTPFEHVVLKFEVKAPIFVARQWFRHRMASYNETSFRYREATDDFYIPHEFRAQDTKNKQGSVAAELDHGELRAIVANHGQESLRRYRLLLEKGVAREMARMVLPTNLYTEWYWTLNARALMHFIGLRSDGHAQYETRQYSHAVAAFFRALFPWTWEAYTNRLEAAVKVDDHKSYAEMHFAVGGHAVDLHRQEVGA